MMDKNVYVVFIIIEFIIGMTLLTSGILPSWVEGYHVILLLVFILLNFLAAIKLLA